MRCFCVILMIAICSAPAVPSTAVASSDRDACAFPAASSVPADVSMLLQINDAASLREELADRPIARWVDAMLRTSEFHTSWKRLAEHAGYDSATLFDRCFGRHVTVAHRTVHGRQQWALMTDMDRDHTTDLLRRLRPRALPAHAGFGMFELPEHELLMARREGRLIIGPRGDAALMMEMIRLIGGPADGINRLGEAECFEFASDFQPGQVSLYLRHERPWRGMTAAVLRLDGADGRIQHRSRFDASPFSRQITSIDIDISPLHRLEDHALLALIEPTDIGTGPFETFLLAAVGEGLLTRKIRENLSDRRILVLGEVEGRQEQRPVDLHAPTFSMAMELKDADGVLAEMDEQMVRLARQLAALGGERFSLQVPRTRSFAEGRDRHIDISPASTWFMGSLPIAQPLTLNWSVVDEVHARYAVVASHPMELAQTHRSLKQSGGEGGKETRGRFQSCGSLHGVRISHHLESWIERPDLFLLDDPALAEEFQQALGLLAQLAAGVERVRWRMARPTVPEVSLDVRFTLAAPESARPE